MTAVLFALFFLLLFANLPVFLALTTSSAIVIGAFTDLNISIVLQRMFSGINKLSLLAVPFFIFAANVMNRGGLAPRLLRFMDALVGHLRGGLAYVVVLTCMFLGAVSGSAPATVVAICSIMLPAMVESGYGKAFSVGLIMASSSVAVIIPPSIGMIIYGTVTNTSIGSLFVAGFIPGLIYGLVFMIYSFLYAKKHNVPVRKRASGKEILLALKEAIWVLGIPIIILGGIYGGFCTPTESAGIAAVYAIIVSLFVYREITPRQLVDVAYESAAGTAQIMLILGGASVFAWLLTRFQIPTILANQITSVAHSKTMVLLAINILLLIAGMFLDAGSIQTIMSPLFLPVAAQYGINPVHLGIIMVVNGAIGMFTPPFGLNLFVAAGITKIPLAELSRKIWIWILLSLIALLIITYIPEISMFLPGFIYS